jgi:hypothetical protein
MCRHTANRSPESGNTGMLISTIGHVPEPRFVRLSATTEAFGNIGGDGNGGRRICNARS